MYASLNKKKVDKFIQKYLNPIAWETSNSEKVKTLTHFHIICLNKLHALVINDKQNIFIRDKDKNGLCQVLYGEQNQCWRRIHANFLEFSIDHNDVFVLPQYPWGCSYWGYCHKICRVFPLAGLWKCISFWSHQHTSPSKNGRLSGWNQSKVCVDDFF